MKTRTRSALVAAATLGFVALAGCGSPSDSGGSADAPDYNVVLISVDALRADHVGAWGYDRPTTPFIDSLAAESVVFERAYAASSFTAQSVSALLTGRLPTSGGSVSTAAQPHEDAETLARLFRGTGLHTGIFSNLPGLDERGFTRGFEGIQIAARVDGQSNQTADDVTANSLQFIDDYAGEPFMLYLHYAEPGQPYSPPATTASAFGVDASDISAAGLTAEIDDGGQINAGDPRMTQLIARYDAEIAAVDSAVAALIAGLEARGIDDNTIVILTGSQGQEFLEHGYLGQNWTLYEELLHVPLILHAPGLLEPERVSAPVSIIDVYPTLAEVFDLDYGSWQPDGSSFLSDSLEVRPLDEPVIAELVIREMCVIRAAVLGDWKYIAEYIPCAVEDRRELFEGFVELVQAIIAGDVEAPSIWGDIQQEMLFDLGNDPGETVNLLDQSPDELAYLRQRLGDYQTYADQYALKAQETVVSPEIREALCGFGYGGNC